ncbi:MAG TPA: hypothetical protein VGL02_31005 [Streptomyces sp.]
MEFAAHVRRLPAIEESALAALLGVNWSPHMENTARLYEVLAYRLDLEWADRTADPDDREVKRRRAEDKRRGVKPPPRPLIPPVALRPVDLAQQRLDAYLAEVAKYAAPARERVFVSSRQFDDLLDLETEQQTPP